MTILQVRQQWLSTLWHHWVVRSHDTLPRVCCLHVYYATPLYTILSSLFKHPCTLLLWLHDDLQYVAHESCERSDMISLKASCEYDIISISKNSISMNWLVGLSYELLQWYDITTSVWPGDCMWSQALYELTSSWLWTSPLCELVKLDWHVGSTPLSIWVTHEQQSHLPAHTISYSTTKL